MKNRKNKLTRRMMRIWKVEKASMKGMYHASGAISE